MRGPERHKTYLQKDGLRGPRETHGVVPRWTDSRAQNDAWRGPKVDGFRGPERRKARDHDGRIESAPMMNEIDNNVAVMRR